MVITFICEVLGEENNGTTIATMNVVRSLRSQGHEVHVVCPDKDKKGLEGYYVVPRIHFGIFDSYVKRNGVTLASAKAFKDEGLLALIRNSDVVHFNFASKLTLLCSQYAHAHGVACTASFHTQAENFTNHVGLMRRSFANFLIYCILNHRLFSQVDAIHYPTEFMRSVFRKHHKTRAKEYIISNGTQALFSREEVERPKEYEGKIVIASTGRYSNEKQQADLIKAMRYSAHRDEIQLIFPGDGPKRKKLEKLAHRYCPNFPLFGFHSREELAKILNYTDIYCHCSYADLEAISCLEAISVGIAPVLSDSPLSAVSGFALDKRNVYKHDNLKDLAAHIDYWIEHPKERKENADSYLGMGKKFALDKMMEKMEQMFLKTIEEYEAEYEGKTV